MLYLKSGSLYWDGKQFQEDYKKSIVCGGAAGFLKDLKKAVRIDPECKIVALSPEHWAEMESGAVNV